MTAECCLENLHKIVKYRQEYTNNIIDEVLQTTNFQIYKEKQKAFLHGVVIELLITAYKNGYDIEKIKKFVNDKKDSPSPKTKKIANKYNKILV